MPRLYVVATPIGNLNDLTPRMRQALEEADLIAAEDTRVTMKLLNHFDLKRPLTSCHRHNEENKAPHIVERMLGGFDRGADLRRGHPRHLGPRPPAGPRLLGGRHPRGARVRALRGGHGPVRLRLRRS